MQNKDEFVFETQSIQIELSQLFSYFSTNMFLHSFETETHFGNCLTLAKIEGN